jgi:hypothetical protein
MKGLTSLNALIFVSSMSEEENPLYIYTRSVAIIVFLTDRLENVRVKLSTAQIHPVKILQAIVIAYTVDGAKSQYKTSHLNIMECTLLINQIAFLKAIDQFLKGMESVCGGINNIGTGGSALVRM